MFSHTAGTPTQTEAHANMERIQFAPCLLHSHREADAQLTLKQGAMPWKSKTRSCRRNYLRRTHTLECQDAAAVN